MFKKSIILFFILFVGHSQSFAQQPEAEDQSINELENVMETQFQNQTTIEQPMADRPRRQWRLLASVGYLAEYEKSVDASSYQSNTQPMFVLGYERPHYQYTLEYLENESSSATGNFSIQNQRQTLNAVFDYLPKLKGSWSPVVGASLGLYQEQVTTLFGVSSNKAVSDAFLVGALRGGVQFQFLGVAYPGVLYSNLLVKVVKRESSKEIEWGSLATLGLRL